MKFDNEDVLLAIKKDKDAFSRLYEAMYMDLYKLAYYMIGNKELAEDAVSDTIIDAYKGIQKLRDPSTFENWILKILTVKCKKIMKIKYNNFSVFNSNARDLEDYNIASPDFISITDDKSDILRALEKISVQDRMIISLCIIEGYKSNEVASILSMNPATVRSRLNRALAKMKNFLEVE